MNKIPGLTILFVLLSACSDKGTYQALGTLERDRIVLKATAAEIITEAPVREGTWVRQGDLLVKLDDTQAKNNLMKAKAAQAMATANQTKLQHGARPEEIAASRAQLEQANAQASDARANFQRIKLLAEQKMVGQAELDKARSSRDAADANVKRTTQNLLALTNGTRIEDLNQADAQVAEAEANLRIAQHQLDQLSIKATRDGLLDRLPKYVGERANLNDPLAVVLAGKAPYARVYVLEPARVHLRVGDSLKVHVDGYPNSFDGKLRWVSHDPAFTPYYALNSRDRALLMYLAEIDLPESAIDLPSGIPVQVDIPSSTENARNKN